MCHLLTRYQSTIFPNHKSCVRKKGVPTGRAPFFRLRDVSVVERDDVHRVGFAVTRAVGERVSDFVAVPYDGGPRRAENRSGGEYVVVADGDRIGHRAAARAVGEVEQLLSLLPDDALLLEAVGVVTRRVERVSEPADGGGFGIGTAVGQGVEQLLVLPDRCGAARVACGVERPARKAERVHSGGGLPVGERVVRLVVFPDHGERLREPALQTACGVDVAARDADRPGLRDGRADRIGVERIAVFPDFRRQGSAALLAPGRVEAAVCGEDRVGVRVGAGSARGVFQRAVFPDLRHDPVALPFVAGGIDRAVRNADRVGPGVVRAVGQGVEQLPVFPDRCDGLRCGRGVARRVDVVAGGFRRFGGVVVRTARREAGECGEKRR